MTSNHILKFFLYLYIFIFFSYLFGPLIIMSITAFNSAEFPAISPWECFSFRWFMDGKIAYDGQLLAGLMSDVKLHDGFIKSLFIATGVVILAVPIGMAAAIMLTQVKSNLRNIFYSISIMPVLFPGVIIGISTVVLWDRLATLGGDSLLSEVGRNGIFLTILAQTCFISTYCFLIFVARMQRFDKTQEEAALDLGASQAQVFFKVLIPYLVPAIASAAVIAFLASFENYNTTVFSILSDQTLTTVIASKVRLGISPAISALAFSIIIITVSAAIIYMILKKREEKNLLTLQDTMTKSNASQSRINKDYKVKFRVPKGIISIIIIIIMSSYIFNQIIENKLYGQSCIDAADTEKKSKFLQQLETLEGNQLTDEELQGGSLGGTNEYGDIFGDPNLFNEYGFGD